MYKAIEPPEKALIDVPQSAGSGHDQIRWFSL